MSIKTRLKKMAIKELMKKEEFRNIPDAELEKVIDKAIDDLT